MWQLSLTRLTCSVTITRFRVKPFHTRLQGSLATWSSVGRLTITFHHRYWQRPQKSHMDNKVSLNILRSYYPVVESLNSYLCSVLGPPTPHDLLIHETDTLLYRNLLKEVYVANPKGMLRTNLTVSAPMVTLKEVGDVHSLMHCISWLTEPR